MTDKKETIARRVAQEMKDGDVVNLGIGIPTMVSNFIPENIHIMLQSENGILGMGGLAQPGQEDPNLLNAGGEFVTITKEASFFDHAASFSIIRGGHVDITVLGALEVDETGSLASHIIPGKKIPGMGGAMDLVVGAKKVIVATTHTKNNGNASIIKRLTLPATAVGKVKLIVTELAVIEVASEGLVLKEIAEGYTVEQVQSMTEPRLIVSPDLKVMFS